MDRIQVMLQPETHNKLKKLVKMHKISVSGFIRKAVEDQIIDTDVSKGTAAVLRDAARDSYSNGPADLSSNDDYLYKTN